jgi:hypothetical protein
LKIIVGKKMEKIIMKIQGNFETTKKLPKNWNRKFGKKNVIPNE